MNDEIAKLLQEIIQKKFSVELPEIKLWTPPKKEMGDIAFACFQLAKQTKLAPPQIALELKQFIDQNRSPSTEGDTTNVVGGEKFNLIQNTIVDGPYLNLVLSKDIYTKQFHEFFPDLMPVYPAKKNETIIVDYIWANVGKPLHIGHMCTPSIGQSLINLYRKLGYNVIGDSHLGDWGIIFGKLLLAYKLWGDEKKLQEDAINYLLKLYVEITSEIEKEQKSLLNEGGASKVAGGVMDWTKSLEQQTRDEFKFLSEGNPDSIKLWEKFTKLSIDFMEIQLARLDVKPTYHIGESFYEWLHLPKLGDFPDLKFNMKQIVEELIEKGIAKRNEDNSVGVEFDKMPSTILQKRDGTHGYLASDLATIKYRVWSWQNIKKIVYSVDVRQELHLMQVFDIVKRAWWVDLTPNPLLSGEGEEKNTIELFHASNGFISLKDGAMSTREWRIIRLEVLLDEAEERAKKIILEKREDITGEELEKLAKIIGIGAIKYWYLSKSRTTNAIFDWDEFMTFEGNSGPYIQYAYVRGKSLESVWKVSNRFLSSQEWQLSSIFEAPEEIELVKECLKYSKILEEMAEKNMPHFLAGYVYELTKKFNSFYNAVNIKNEPDEGKKTLRLALVQVFCNIVKDGFEILGIEVPEKM